MARIHGVDIPNNKKIGIALTYIYGIGKKTAEIILRDLGIDSDIKAKDISEEDLSRLAAEIQKNYVIEGQLHRQIRQNIQRLKEIGCYRGVRHRRGLPVRGQRTRSNARTRKGPRKTVAGKKKAAAGKKG
ncbi:MAG: 30S ribosomal protein S13 [Planctomycetes bacterium]|jgi:small subunit ribosomal protein S13|nr:30S ribosomal protein S13 [Planctomycetota bacterium]HPY75093.1 30S ribosomal protein S13 [Planctomycetota bacterium]HQB00661.1 30S ribosomal protein S13 [Planctomycetota bacterium]HRU51579.1 30S ribosomal protein S13 [Planctomycetota bacterium]